MTYLDAPSPHGAASATYVEVLDESAAADVQTTDAHRWVKTEDASYVFGIEREGVMGMPVLVYDQLDAARTSASAHHGDVLSWDGLRHAYRSAMNTPRN